MTVGSPGSSGSPGDGASLVGRREPIVYVVELASPEIDALDLHHLQRVLRLREGASICLCDGRGRWQPARLVGDRAEPIDEVRVETAPSPSLSVVVALPKGDRADWMVQKVTELGIDAIGVLNAERSVVRWHLGEGPGQGPAAGAVPAKGSKGSKGSKVSMGAEAVKASGRGGRGRTWERFERVVHSAGAQSRRAFLPSLEGPQDLTELARGGGPAGAVALAHPGGGPMTPDLRTVLIGPEGGWSPAELALGLPTVGLGPHVLRVETAALAATTLLVALRSQQVSFARAARENALGG
ncbi:MAG: RsmE family RNA methyltransferase [Acidimicrobiales bacterium]